MKINSKGWNTFSKFMFLVHGRGKATQVCVPPNMTEKHWTGRNTSWNQDCQEKHQQSQICGLYHSNGRKWRETKEPLDEGEWGEWKNWLKTQVPSLHGKWRGKWKQWQIFFLASKISVDGDCSQEIKRRLFLGRKATTSLDNVLKSRDITLLTKICIVKGMVFPVVTDVRVGP